MRHASCFLLVLILAGCGSDSSSDHVETLHVIVTEVPAGKVSFEPTPAERYPSGSRIRKRVLEGRGEDRLLSEGLDAAGGAVTMHDGTSILFTARPDPGRPYAIYACSGDGGDRRVIVAAERDVAEPALLPDGRIVYMGRLAETGPRGAAWALFVADGRGGPGERITFGTGLDIDPALLPDGRIVYASWQPEPRGMSLFTVHPDGTGFARLAGGEGVQPLAQRPYVVRGDVLFVRRGRKEGGVAWRLDGRTGETQRLLPLDELSPLDDVTCVAEDPRDIDGVLSAVLPGRVEKGGVHATTSRPRWVIQNHPGWWIVHLMVRVPRDRPQGHLSSVQPMRWGQLLGLNARWPQGAGGTRIRLTALDGAFANGSRPGGRTLGEVALEADGSFFVQVPVDVPLLLDLLDDDGTLVVEGKTPFWLRPNETRACVGCHEPPGMAPPNRRPLALAHGVKPLTAVDEGDR